MLDLHPASDARFRLWSHLSPSEGILQVDTRLQDVPTTTHPDSEDDEPFIPPNVRNDNVSYVNQLARERARQERHSQTPVVPSPTYIPPMDDWSLPSIMDTLTIPPVGAGTSGASSQDDLIQTTMNDAGVTLSKSPAISTSPAGISTSVSPARTVTTRTRTAIDSTSTRIPRSTSTTINEYHNTCNSRR